MKFYFDKSKCKVSESLNGFVLEVETDEEVEFTGSDGHDYILFGESPDGLGDNPYDPFVVEKPKN